jgi:hypothetical protein
MNRYRAGAALIAGSAFLFAAQANEPYLPAADDRVLEHVSAPRLPGLGALAELRAEMQRHPGVLAPAVQFARAAIDIGKREEDPRYFGYAESALQAWLNQPAPPFEVSLLHAQLLIARMDFPSALSELDRVAAAGAAESVQALLVRALLNLRRGDIAAAGLDCGRLKDHVDALLTASCEALVQGAGGRAAEALNTLDRQRSGLAAAPLAVQLWSLGAAAELSERLGRGANAIRLYQEAAQRSQAAGSRDPGLLAAYADCLLDSGQETEVLRLVSGLERIDGLLVRQATAERRLGRADPALAGQAATHTRQLAARFAELRQRDGVSHLREQGLFELDLRDDAAAALALAQRNWAIQREASDIRLLLRAAVAAGQAQSAQPVLDWLAATGYQDARLAPQLDALRSTTRSAP